MSESPEYKLDNGEDYTPEEKEAIARTLRKIRKRNAPEKQTDSDEDDGMEEVMSPAVMWERIKELEAQGIRKSNSSSGSSSSTVVSMERKFEVLKCSSKEKGNPLPADQVHSFADILASNSAKRGTGNPYTKADLLSFVEQKAQALITSRHQAKCLEDEDVVSNIFELPAPDFAARLKILFPKFKSTETHLDVIRSLKNGYTKNWWKTESHLEPFVIELLSLFDFVEEGQWKSDNGGVCTAQEFPKLYEAFQDVFLPDSSETPENKKDPTWCTNRGFLETIDIDPPTNLNQLFTAIINVGREISQDYANAKRNGWFQSVDHERQSNYKGSKPWDPCDKCGQTHHRKLECPTKKPVAEPKVQPTKDGHLKPAPTKQSDTAGGKKYQGSKRFGGNKFKDGVPPWKRPRDGNKPSGGQGNSGVKVKASEIDTTLREDIYQSSTDTIIVENIKMTQEIDLVTVIQPLESRPPVNAGAVSNKRGRVVLDKVNINITPSDAELINNIIEQKTPPSSVPMVLINKDPSIEYVLIDSGSIKSNYIDITLFNRLKAQGIPIIPLPKRRRVCSGLAGIEEQMIHECMEIMLVFINELTNKEQSIVIQVHPIRLRDDSSFSIIIGLPIIQQHRLANKFPSIFEDQPYNHLKYFKPLSHFLSEEYFLVSQGREGLTSEEVIMGIDHTQDDLVRCAHSSGSTDSAQTEEVVLTDMCGSQSPEDFEGEEPLYTRFERQVRDTCDSKNISGGALSLEALLTMVQIFGPETLRSKLTKLLVKYYRIFSLTVSPSPAVVDKPMEIIIDRAQWENKKNSSAPRLQSQLKEVEIQKQVEGLLANGVIRPSKARYWSQVHLTPKPTPGEWRFCIDYRRLNAATVPTESHPLPRIDHMLLRLGRRKAQYFGVIDLTAGYHQVPLDPAAIPLTAFICFAGLFEFVRLPFGLANAVSYFQRFIAIVVLSELMYKIVENYVDDVIVTGLEEDDFVQNVEAVFKKFDEHNIKVNPKKVKLGLHQVECVGHVVDKEGVHFSRSKLDSVLNFKKPEYAAQMKSFLGLSNYFRSHVKNYSELSRPLNDMVAMKPYNRRNKLTWTAETTQAYETLKLRIHECPKLFFMRDGCPIHLYSDASDYGIGAYLVQIIEGKEVPIAFISKTLNTSQRKWSTPEKECYAIYYSLIKLEHLLLDTEFVIHTDHKNLTFLDESANARVNRWKLALQEYRFTIEYIKGADNVVADAFSRLCLLSEEVDLSEDELISAFVDEEVDEVNHIISTSWHYPQEYAKILGQFHNSEVGHFGVDRTVNKLLATGNRWEHMRRHVKAFIKKCPCCQVMSQLKPAIHTLPYVTSTYNPMESLNVDTIGPLPPDESDNTYILVIIDRFSRWIELYATKDATAKSAAINMISHFGRYGTASELRSDGGSQFVNEIIQQVLLLMGTQHQITLAYSKQENSIVERSNKEVVRHLRNIIFDKRVLPTWAIYLPLVQRMMNASIHSALGVSPAQILFGNAIDLDRNLSQWQKCSQFLMQTLHYRNMHQIC